MKTCEDVALKDQLMYLLELQTIDTKVKELEAARQTLPARTEPLRRDLAKLEGMLGGERQKLAETETWKKQQAEMLAREYEAMRAAKNKLQGSKTGKEYNAASREVDNKKKSIQDRESELKKVTEALSSGGNVIGERDAAVAQLREQLATEEAQIAVKVEEVQKQITEASAGREELRGKIEKSWLKTYDTLAGKRGFAVSPVVGGVCQGCQMRIPPQLNNILARMESLEMCPRCGRIIYRKEMLEPKSETPAAES
jgi:predicted  nucleic acid-binding Zn-ribbon protein